jgi:hypothetical protein
LDLTRSYGRLLGKKSEGSRRRLALSPPVCPSSALFFSSLSRHETPDVRVGVNLEGRGEDAGASLFLQVEVSRQLEDVEADDRTGAGAGAGAATGSDISFYYNGDGGMVEMPTML